MEGSLFNPFGVASKNIDASFKCRTSELFLSHHVLTIVITYMKKDQIEFCLFGIICLFFCVVPLHCNCCCRRGFQASEPAGAVVVGIAYKKVVSG